MKDSPHVRQKNNNRTKNENFLMSIKATLPLDDISQSSSVSVFQPVIHKEEKTQKTILFTKEVVDTDKDYLSMEIKEFVKLSEEELGIAYNRLLKMIIPIFSGSVNTLINKIDLKKAVEDDYKLIPRQKNK